MAMKLPYQSRSRVKLKPDPLHELAGRNRCDGAKSVASAAIDNGNLPS